MKYSEGRVLKNWPVVAGLVMALVCGCRSVRPKAASWESVRTVDFKLAPQAQALAERARQTGNTFYPAVCALLADGSTDFPPQFDICLIKKLPASRSGETRITRICLDARYVQYWQDNPAAFDQVLVHEMAHVAQHYERAIVGRWVVSTSRPPSHWQEGMAEYVSFKLGQTNGWQCSGCVSMFPHYRNGYSCAGAFLLYVEGAYNTNLVKQLHAVLRQGRYTDDFFRQATGKDLEALWAEFQRTPAFTPGAVRMLELQQSLGFVNGRPPKDFERRLQRFLEEHADKQTRDIMKRASVLGQKAGSIQVRLTLACYFTQPGGTAEAFLVGMGERYELPGFAKGEHGNLTGTLLGPAVDAAFPATRTFTATKQGDPSIYHYTVYRGSQESGWELRRAWRTDPEGNVVEELDVRGGSR